MHTFIFIIILLFILFYWLCWVFTAMLPLLSLQWLLLLRSSGSRIYGLQQLQHTGSVVVACGLNCSAVWNLPGLGIKPKSSALEGRFLSTAPPGTSKTLLTFKYTPQQEGGEVTHTCWGSPWFTPSDHWEFILVSKVREGSNLFFHQIINTESLPPTQDTWVQIILCGGPQNHPQL